MKALRHLILFLFFAFAGGGAAFAQLDIDAMKEPLPVEIVILHEKLLDRTPDYDTLIRRNFMYSPETGQDDPQALLARQKAALEKVYDRAGKGRPILVKKALRVTSLDDRSDILRLEPIHADEPVLFETRDGEKYGIFLSNSSSLETLTAVFVFEDFKLLQQQIDAGETEYPAELVVDPQAADPNDFPLATGETVRVILGKVTDIRIFHPRRRELLVHKTLVQQEAAAEADLSLSKIGAAPADPDGSAVAPPPPDMSP